METFTCRSNISIIPLKVGCHAVVLVQEDPLMEATVFRRKTLLVGRDLLRVDSTSKAGDEGLS
jgi:hypothetical protein